MIRTAAFYRLTRPAFTTISQSACSSCLRERRLPPNDMAPESEQNRIARKIELCAERAAECVRLRNESVTIQALVSLPMGVLWIGHGGWIIGITFFAMLVILPAYHFVSWSRTISGWLALQSVFENYLASLE